MAVPRHPPSSSSEPVGQHHGAATHYARLEVTATATPEELRQAFRRLSKRFHPDTTPLPAAEAEQAFRRLRQAYAVLSDPEARRRYDGELRLAALAAAARSAPDPVIFPAPQPRGESVDAVRRALSGGEWLALLLLALALVFSLVIGVGVAVARGAELSTWPSWWPAG